MRCETCGRRVDPNRKLRKGMVGALIVYRAGQPFAWCPEHARHRPPWHGRAGWPYMRELDRLWAKAEAHELLAMLKNGGRDLTFQGASPFAAGETIKLGRHAWCVIEWVRQAKPGTFTVRVRRFENEQPRMLRPGGPPLTDPTGMGAGMPSPDEIEKARLEGNYLTDSDPLDGGQIPPGDVRKYKASVQAKARYAEVYIETHGPEIAEQQGKQLMRRMRRLQTDAAKLGVDLTPKLIGMLREAEREVGEARRAAA